MWFRWTTQTSQNIIKSAKNFKYFISKLVSGKTAVPSLSTSAHTPDGDERIYKQCWHSRSGLQNHHLGGRAKIKRYQDSSKVCHCQHVQLKPSRILSSNHRPSKNLPGRPKCVFTHECTLDSQLYSHSTFGTDYHWYYSVNWNVIIVPLAQCHLKFPWFTNQVICNL